VIVASVTGSITSAIGDQGVYAVFGLMVLDAVFPAASELVMLYAGAVAAGAIAGSDVTLFGHTISTPFWAFLTMALAGTIGNTIGSVIGWAIGLYGGRPLLERHGRFFHLGPERMARADRWFDRWGDASVFIGRVTPVARSFVSIPAGVLRMPLGRFTVLTFFGCLIWCLALTGIGWAIGTKWHNFHDSFKYVDYAILGLAVMLLGWVVWRVWSARSTKRATPDLDS
jgi:membrane protein DedA with SNARE-associated domain